MTRGKSGAAVAHGRLLKVSARQGEGENAMAGVRFERPSLHPGPSKQQQSGVGGSVGPVLMGFFLCPNFDGYLRAGTFLSLFSSREIRFCASS